MVAACVSTRGSGGMLPQENFEFRSSQIASDAKPGTRLLIPMTKQ